MKFRNGVLMVACCMLLTTPIMAKSETMTINNKDVVVEVQEKNNRKLIPLRKVADELGLRIAFFAKDEGFGANSIIIDDVAINSSNPKILYMNIDSKKVSIGGQDYELDVAPIAINNSTYVPIRVICDAFGMNINIIDGKTIISKGDGKTKLANIISNSTSSNQSNSSPTTYSQKLKDSYISGAEKLVYNSLGTNGRATCIFKDASFSAEGDMVYVSGRVSYLDHKYRYKDDKYVVSFDNKNEIMELKVNGVQWYRTPGK